MFGIVGRRTVAEDFIAVAEVIRQHDLMELFDNRLYSKEDPELANFR